MPREVLITGGTGFVGPILAKALLGTGDRVWMLIRRRADGLRTSRLTELGLLGSVGIVEGDLTNLTSMIFAADRVQPDVVFHLAGQSFVPQSFKDPLETFAANSMGTQNLLEAMRLKCPDTAIVYAGSSEEYGLQIASEAHLRWAERKYGAVTPRPNRIPELPINEESFLRPMSPYAVSKLCGDFLTRNYFFAYGLRGIVSRAFNHEGAGRGHSFVTSAIVRQCVSLKQGEVDSIELGNVCAARDWSHVDDIIGGYDLLSRKGLGGEVYVMGSRRSNTVLAYLLCTLSRLGFDVSKLQTMSGDKTVTDPLQKVEKSCLGTSFAHYKIDEEIFVGSVSYDLSDKGLFVGSGSDKVRVVFDEAKFRPAEVPVLISETSKAEKLGFKATRSLDDIISDQIDYYLDPANRKPLAHSHP